MRFLILCGGLCMLFAAGCTKVNEETLILEAREQELCSKDTFSYATDIVPIIHDYCISCHSAALANGSVVLETYDQVNALATSGDLMGTIHHDPGYSPMPDDGRHLSNCQLKAMETWVNQGSRNN